MANAMRAITDGICWRYILPGPKYFRELRIGKFVPEVRGELNRIRFLRWAGVAVYTPLVALALPFFVMRWLSDAVLDFNADMLAPNFGKAREDAVQEALAKVPLATIRERIGEPVSRILTKDECAA